MDPLAKLAERNIKQEQALKSERKEILLFMPLSVAIGVFYLFVFSALSSEHPDFLGISFMGVDKQVWIISMLFFNGLGILLCAVSIKLYISLLLFGRENKLRVRKFYAFIKTSGYLSCGISLFFIAGGLLHNTILNNQYDIVWFLRFGAYEVPYFITMALNLFIFLELFALINLLWVLIKLPFKEAWAQNSANK